MEKKEWIRKDILSSMNWTDKLLKEVNETNWKVNPKSMKTNINWQVGHMIISHYFHCIASIIGSDEKIKEQFSPRQFSVYYGMGSSPTKSIEDKPNHQELLNHLSLVDRRSLEILDDISEDALVEAPIINNPVAKLKEDAFIWSVKHRMWHNGQIALISSHLKDPND